MTTFIESSTFADLSDEAKKGRLMVGFCEDEKKKGLGGFMLYWKGVLIQAYHRFFYLCFPFFSFPFSL
jgi:hypothetical protein